MANKNTGFKYKDYLESQSVKDKQNALNSHLSNKVGDFTYQDYKESDAVNQALDKLQSHNQNKPDKFEYDKQAGWDNIMNQILNRKDFSYDLGSDALYQQYKDQYMNQGALAMQDTMGQAAALTGGYGNSYAQSVGQQTYQGYLQQLNDKVPQLYQLALDKYNQETSDLYNKYGLYQSDYDTKYGAHRDDLADWYTDRDYLTGRYDTERQYDYNKYTDSRDFAYGQHRDKVTDWQTDRDYLANDLNNERNWDYGQYSDAYDRAYTEHTNAIANEQWQREFDEAKRQYDAKLAEEQRQYNQNLAEQQRQYNYEMELAAAQAASESQEDDFQRYTFSHVDDDGLYHFYKDGKEYSFQKGQNPYGPMPDKTVEDAKNGTFSNGYQPDNVDGVKLEPTGVTTTEINGVPQNVWKTTDKGVTKFWVWNGEIGMYEECENPHWNGGYRSGR